MADGGSMIGRATENFGGGNKVKKGLGHSPAKKEKYGTS